MRPLTVFQLTPLNSRPPKSAGEKLPVALELTITGHTGHDERGPHPIGRAEVLADGRLRIAIADTLAGRHAIAMLNEEMLDVVLEPGSVRLR